MVAILVIGTLVALLVVDALVRMARSRRAATVAAPAPTPLRMADVTPPGGLFMAKGNTWLALQPKGTLRVGGTPLALRALGRLRSIDVPPTGRKVKKGQPLFTVKVGAREAAFRSPVDGEIVAVNPAVLENPDGLPAAAYQNWILEVRSEAPAAALENLPVAERAVQWVRREYDRLRDILVQVVSPNTAPEMADGGEPLAGVLELCDDRAWDEATSALLDPTAD